MSRKRPTLAERQQLADQRIQAKAEAEALAAGVMETVALSAHRGAEFACPPTGRIRRLTGLDWLAGKGRLTSDQMAAATRYGAVYRAAEADPSIRSNIASSVSGGADRTSTITRNLHEAEKRVQAQRKLREMRSVLAFHPDLINALDTIAGRELTPREASPKGADAKVLERLLMVALDLLLTWEDA